MNIPFLVLDDNEVFAATLARMLNRRDFDAAVAHAKAHIVAPVSGPDGAPCWPGQCAGVIRVGLDRDLPRGTVHVIDGVHHACGYPRPIPGVDPRRNLHGISFATAQVSGWVAGGLVNASGTRFPAV